MDGLAHPSRLFIVFYSSLRNASHTELGKQKNWLLISNDFQCRSYSERVLTVRHSKKL